MHPPENTQPIHPGLVLNERFLEPIGILPQELAAALQLPQQQITELLSGNADIDVDFATRLGAYLDAPARWFLDLQADFDAGTACRVDVARCPNLADFLVTPKGVIALEQNNSSEPAAPTLHFSSEFEARLREQVKHCEPRRAREPVTVCLADGTPILTGR
ncbi:MAG: addiction module HigA family antidote [Rhodothermales bacterium]|jgi:addiction module HigA family antidote